MREALWIIAAILLGQLAMFCGGVAYAAHVADLKLVSSGAGLAGMFAILGVMLCARRA